MSLPMETTRSRHILPLAAILVFVISLAGYVGLRAGISSDLYGGDTVNISSYTSSFAISRSSVDLQVMAKAILTGRHDHSPENPHAFVYGELSVRGRAALERFVNDGQDTRSETEFVLDLERSLINREVSWPVAFRGRPLVEEGRMVQHHDIRGKNLLALAAVYPLQLPVNHVVRAFKELGVWEGLKAMKPYAVSAFTLSSPTRYSPVTNTYVLVMQSFLEGRPDLVIVGVVVTGFLYATLALTVFLLAEIIIGSIPWAVASAFFTMAATSTIAASVTLFSLPYLFVPIVMGMAFYAYLQFKKSGSRAWLLLFSLSALLGPWFREFAAAIPFIVLACEIVLPSARRSWVVLTLCLVFVGHSVYPSFFTWMIGLNKGIVAGVFQQANTQAQVRDLSPGNLGMLFVQFPPSFWILTTFSVFWWFWHRFGPKANARFQLPFRDISFSLPAWAAPSWQTRIGFLAAYLATTVGLIIALLTAGDSTPFSAISWSWAWDLGLGFFVFIGLFFLRFGPLLPTYFVVTFTPFLWLSLAEVHMAFTIPPLAIMLTVWVKELFHGLAEAGLRKVKLVATMLLAIAIGDQIANFPASYKVQKSLVEANQAVADWVVGHTPRNSIVISNCYNYTDIYYLSGNYFDPFESVENNPLGPARTIHRNDQMRKLLADNFNLRDIYLLAGDHDFFEWQRGYHSHKWVNNPPGNIRMLEEFPTSVYYYYLDPFKYFIPRNLVSFLGYMDWSTDYYFNNDKTPFRRIVDVTYKIFRVEDVDPLALQDRSPQNFPQGPSFASSPVLLKESIGSNDKYNLVHFKDRFYAVPQALGAVDWWSGKVGAMKGVIVATTPEEAMMGLSEAKPEFTSSPILLKESIGPKGKYNLIHFEDRFYAVPQALGAVDWTSGKVGAMEGVIVGVTPEEAMTKVGGVKPVQ